MRRKNIAVCVTGYDAEYESLIIKGIYDRCVENDINLLVFASMIKKPELSSAHTLADSTVRGESEIFNLINYDMIDGLIIMGDSIVNEAVITEVDRRTREKGIVMVNVSDPQHKAQKNVLLSDSTAMGFVVDHLIEEHGLKHINFIGGFPGNLQTEERLSAYKNSLTRHGIPVEEDRIAYGEFWKKAAECTAKFMEAGEKPEAIACASDSMAFFSVEWLKDHGYKVPDDIIVTGFDGIKDGSLYSPSITTVRKDFEKAGTAAVDVILDVLAGKDVPDDIYIDSALCTRQSCGCVPIIQQDVTDFYSKHYDELNTIKGFNNYSLDMDTKYASAATSQELFESAQYGATFFGLKRLYICIGADIECSEPSLENRTDSRYNGICNTMVSMLKYGHDIPVGTKFRSADLIPEDILNGEKPVIVAFSPLYFKDDFLGYLAFEPSKIIGIGELFPTWTTQLSSNAGSFYMNKELQYFVDKLESLYMCDPLTGLYNRRGLDRLGKQLLKQAKSRGELFTVFVADIDHLKPINDIYGHEAGDNAILQTAKAIKKAMSENAVCVRTGGDEYCVLISHTEENQPEALAEQVALLLEEYNKDSGLAYKVGCSCGWCTARASELERFDELSARADENMYRTKMAKKAAR